MRSIRCAVIRAYRFTTGGDAVAYRVTDKRTGAVVRPGDRVAHWRPENGTGVFEAVESGPNGRQQAKVRVDGRVHFAKAWQLEVTG